MHKVYADLIRKGLKTIDEVPERIRESVQDILDEQKEEKTIWKKR